MLVCACLVSFNLSAQIADTTANTDAHVQDTVKTVDSLDRYGDLTAEISTLKDKMRQDSATLAQTSRRNNVWTKSNPFMLYYGSLKFKDKDAGVEYKSDLSAGMSKNHNYYLHSRAIADLVKIGLDVTWIDFNVTRFEKGSGFSLGNITGNITSGNYSNFDDYFNDAYGNANDYNEGIDVQSIINKMDLGKYMITYSMGLGPSVTVVPFYTLNQEILDKIKVIVSFQYLPTFSGLLLTGKNYDNAFCSGYTGLWRYRISLSFARFGIGVEHRWGKGTMNKWNISGDEEEFGFDSDKFDSKLSGTFFFIGYKF